MARYRYVREPIDAHAYGVLSRYGVLYGDNQNGFTRIGAVEQYWATQSRKPRGCRHITRQWQAKRWRYVLEARGTDGEFMTRQAAASKLYIRSLIPTK